MSLRSTTSRGSAEVSVNFEWGLDMVSALLQNGPQYVAFYNAVNLGKNSGNWGPPRQIRFGLKLDY